MDNKNLKANVPTVTLGNRNFAIVRDSWKTPSGEVKPQAYLNEVTPLVEGMTVVGWKPTFKGARIPLPIGPNGDVEAALLAFCKAWVEHLTPMAKRTAGKLTQE